LFSRRSHHNSCYNECNTCHTETYSGCGSHGGSQGVIYESQGQPSQQDSGVGNPPPAPSDPGSASQGQGGAATVAPTPTVVSDRRQTVILASNRRFGRIFR
jgi:hypothetical protein